MSSNEAGWSAQPAAEIEYGSPQWVIERDKKLAAWEASKQALEKAKSDEMELRKDFVEFAFNKAKLEGTERIPLHNGFEAKAVKKLNFTFKSPSDDIEVADAVDMALQRIEALGPEGKFIAGRLVKWTATLSISEYRELPNEVKAIIDTVIETKQGAPTLEIVPPKGQR